MSELLKLADEIAETIPKQLFGGKVITLSLSEKRASMLVDALRAYAPQVCRCGPMCEDKHRPGCRYFDVTPTRVALRALVDAVWQHATESTAVPSTDTADRLITKTIIASHDAAPAQPDLERIAKSLASMLTEYVEGGINSNQNWRNGLNEVILARLRRLSTAAPVHIVKITGHGGKAGCNDYLMSDGDTRTMTSIEADAFAHPNSDVGRGNSEKVLEAIGMGIMAGRKQCITALQTVKYSGLPVPDIDTLIEMMGQIEGDGQ